MNVLTWHRSIAWLASAGAAGPMLAARVGPVAAVLALGCWSERSRLCCCHWADTSSQWRPNVGVWLSVCLVLYTFLGSIQGASSYSENGNGFRSRYCKDYLFPYMPRSLVGFEVCSLIFILIVSAVLLFSFFCILFCCPLQRFDSHSVHFNFNICNWVVLLTKVSLKKLK